MRLGGFVTIAAAGLMLVACDSRTDDVVRSPAPDLPPEKVKRSEAKLAETEAATALGMTRRQLEHADLVALDGRDLGDIEHLVTDSAGNVTHLVVELDHADNLEVLLPIGQVKVDEAGRHKNLVTELSAEDLAALPRYIPAR